jgi:uncharacterized membrane protein
MILWSIAVAAFLGLALGGYDPPGMVAGAFVGAIAGWWLRTAVRAQVARGNDKLLAEVRDWVTSQSIAPATTQPVAASPLAVPESVATPVVPPLPVEVPERIAELARIAADPAPEPGPAYIAEPAAPNFIESGFAAARNWLLGGNTIVRVGLVILFIGLSFLARYAASAGLFPPELRLALIAAVGTGLLVIGFNRRTARPGFAVALQGAGVATLYLTIFAAFKLFAILGVWPAFALMVVICGLGCALALLQDSQSLAVSSFIGGFAVPILLATDNGGMVPLFGYYTLLSLAVLFIAQARSWRFVNLTGFFSTFGIATLWGVLSYNPASYATSQGFLIAFVLIYVAAAILYARNTPPRPGSTSNVVDSTLLFGPALAGFGLQAGLVHDVPFGPAFSALGFGALYLVLAAVLMRRGRGSYRLMTECMLAIGIGFVTLAVPLALGAEWTSSVWALEGAGAFWVGSRQARWMPRAFGLVLQVVAALVYFEHIGNGVHALPLANPMFIGGLLVALPALAIAWWLRASLPHSGSRWATGYAGVEAVLSKPMFLFGFLFWCLTLALEIGRNTPPLHVGGPALPVFDIGMQRILTMLAVVASAWVSSLIGRRASWPVATWPGRATLVLLTLAFLAQAADADHILHTPDWAIWLVALGLHYHLLYSGDRDPGDAAVSGLFRLTHVGSVWLLTLMLADCLWFWIDKALLWQTSWGGVVTLVSSVAVLMLLAGWAGRANQAQALPDRRWPLNPHAIGYFWVAALPLALLVFLGTLGTALVASGNTRPLPYIPMLNPIDLTLALALATLTIWRRVVVAAVPAPPGSAWLRGRRALAALAGLAFICINTVWLRTAHHYLGVVWLPDTMLADFAVETGLSILWTLLALGLMMTAHRRMKRAMWLTGAALLALVVAKLLLVDQSNAGGGERIITFIVVGLLMLIVGYFAPLPPKPIEAELVAVPA